jgi:hypothetical protein
MTIYTTLVTHEKNVVGLTIPRALDKLNFSIYRKPTFADILIHNSSCNPYEHKMAHI